MVATPAQGAPADTDGDGLFDAFEIANGFDPADPDEDSNGKVDGQDDTDLDGLGNATEQLAGTDPNNSDTDNDGHLDLEELGRRCAAHFRPGRVEIAGKGIPKLN